MPRMASLLESKLPGATLEILRTAGEIAAEGQSGASDAYLVGGSVRDLVLGRDPKDIDIVVTGNGQRFARSLAEKIDGSLDSTSQFGTASISHPDGRFDVVTARSESYITPGALPDVEPSTMEQDLARRDFSVNAMALSIRPDTWGDLLDPHRGFSDCARKKVRILHDTSFQDDPTRMVRAVRFCVRLEFALEIGTAEALDRDLLYLDRVSGARLLAELQKILAEPARVEIIRRAESLGVLGAISPSLRVTEQGLKAMEKFGSEGDSVDELLYVASLTSSLTEEEAESVITRLEPDADWKAVIRGAAAFRNIASMLESGDRLPSEVVSLLENIPTPVIELQRIAGPRTRQREHIEAYLRRHRSVRPVLTGDDLISLGVPHGPMIGRLLDELRTALLDGKISGRAEEQALVMRRLPVLQSREGSGNGQPAGAAAP